MIEVKEILPLLGLPSEKIKSVDVINESNESTIYIELMDIRGICPKCKSSAIEIKDYYTVCINNSIIKHHKLNVEKHLNKIMILPKKVIQLV